MSVQITPIKRKADVQPGDDITELILSASKNPIDDGDVIVISQKNYIKTRGSCNKPSICNSIRTFCGNCICIWERS